MLTRIELDGFKSFEGFALDLGPHAVVLGPNGAGKSNLFDAIRFLSALADHSLADAAREMRGLPHELFSFDGAGQPRADMRLAVEVLLPKGMNDPWGNEVRVLQPGLRYEVRLERRDEGGMEKLVVVEERVTAFPIHNTWRPYSRPVSDAFRKTVLRRPNQGKRKNPFLDTEKDEEGRPTFTLYQDGNAGRKRTLPASGADATVLSTISTVEFTHLFALREELRSWRFFQLDPVAIRDATRSSWAHHLEADGRNLGRVLNRIRARTRSEESPNGLLPDIANDLAGLVDGVRTLDVEEDEAIRDFRIRLGMAGRVPYSSQLLSDGTLRLLALFTLFNDPDFSGLLCMEEPENGVHPQRLVALMRHFRAHVTDPFSDDPDPDEPLQQVLTNSHSPVVLSAVRDQEGEAFFADTITKTDPRGLPVRRTRIRPVARGEQEPPFRGEPTEPVPHIEVERFLNTVKSGG